MWGCYVLIIFFFFLTPGGCPAYDVNLRTIEVPNDFQNELELQTALNSEMNEYRENLNKQIRSRGTDEKFFELTPLDTWDTDEAVDASEADVDVSDLPVKKPDIIKQIETDAKAQYYADDLSMEQADAKNSVESVEEEGQETVVKTSFAATPTKKDMFLGTNLFGPYRKVCFSMEEVALLAARKDFEVLIPKTYPCNLLTEKSFDMLMKYFNSVNQIVRRMSQSDTRRLSQRAYYDALGAYLRYYLVPVAKVSYYSGSIRLHTVQKGVALYQKCKTLLNTNGNGWKSPIRDVLNEFAHANIKPIRIKPCKSNEVGAANCAALNMECNSKDAENDLMIVPLPKLDPEDACGYLTNINLPFKEKRVYNLRSPNSAYIFVKFYTMVARCYKFLGTCPKKYNEKLQNWITENLKAHFNDEELYPGLGAVMRVYETLNGENKKANQKCVDILDEIDSMDSHGDKQDDWYYKTVCNKERANDTKTMRTSEKAMKRPSRRPYLNTNFDNLENFEEKLGASDKEIDDDGKAKPTCPAKKVYKDEKDTSKDKDKNSHEDQDVDAQDKKVLEHANKSHDAKNKKKDEEDQDKSDKSDQVKGKDPDYNEVPSATKSYINYIYFLLGLLLILLLIIICCCLGRGMRNREATPTHTSHRPHAATSAEESESHKKSYYPAKPEPSKCCGMTRSKHFVGPSEKFRQHRKYYGASVFGLADENAESGGDTNYDSDGSVSTTSLLCQPSRKCVPLPFSKKRTTMKSYYAIEHRSEPSVARSGDTKKAEDPKKEVDQKKVIDQNKLVDQKKEEPKNVNEKPKETDKAKDTGASPSSAPKAAAAAKPPPTTDDDDDYEELSTSSLTCQPSRKCLPTPLHSEPKKRGRQSGGRESCEKSASWVTMFESS